MTSNLILRGLGLGFSSGLFCAGFCLPLLSPVFFSRERPGIGSSATALALFLLGRLVAYLFLGLLFGLMGSALLRAGQIRTVLIPLLYGLLGLLLLLYGLVHSFPHINLCAVLKPSFQSPWALLVLGFLAGINPCPPLLLALTTAIDIAGPVNGILFFLCFFLATAIWLLPLLLSGLLNRFVLVRVAARIVAIITGLYFMFRAFAHRAA